MNTLLIEAQYKLVQSARAALLDYCATLAAKDFVAAVPAFHHKSPRDLLAHVAAVYHHWLGVISLDRPASYPEPANVPDVAAAQQLFDEVDALVADWRQHVAGRWLQPQMLQVPGRPEPLTLPPLAVFTHVVTHEFHHKGQLLTMSRQLGYVPVDTDIIRF